MYHFSVSQEQLWLALQVHAFVQERLPFVPPVVQKAQVAAILNVSPSLSMTFSEVLHKQYPDASITLHLPQGEVLDLVRQQIGEEPQFQSIPSLDYHCRSYDFIHLQLMALFLKEPELCVQLSELMTRLRPGGFLVWTEVVGLQSTSPQLTRWCQLLEEARRYRGYIANRVCLGTMTNDFAQMRIQKEIYALECQHTYERYLLFTWLSQLLPLANPFISATSVATYDEVHKLCETFLQELKQEQWVAALTVERYVFQRRER